MICLLYSNVTDDVTYNVTDGVTGIDNMIKNDIYTAAYPLHDVSITVTNDKLIA